MLKNKTPDVIGLVTNTAFLIILNVLPIMNLINFLVKYLMQNWKNQN